MGTSTSSKGPKNNSPLVPPWADDTPDQPIPPPPEGQRFKAFRVNMGKFVNSSENHYLRRSLGEYARAATGGSAIGSRRYGAMSKAGSSLFGVMNELRQGGTGEESSGVDLSALAGKDVDFAIQEIVTALTPENGDAEKIRAAMQPALSEALEGVDEFDPLSISDEMIVDMMIFYLRECVFEQVIMDSNEAFQKGDLQKCQEAEGSLHDLINSVVDQHMRPYLSDGVSNLTQSQVKDIQQNAIKEVLIEWEGYEPW
ncbi:MAG: hypothetical protein PHF56_14810 [Desulfuromonadaceae bacterium]|nr:hypothetical protein [Desulfuromonadaceae bacterium]